MKRLKFLAILVAWLVLSHHAQSAEVESTRSQLTAAAKALCRDQLTNVNQGILAYNVKVDAIGDLNLFR